MKSKFILSSIFVFVVLAQCHAQVPDSVRNAMQVPVFQQDTLPADSLIVSADTSMVADSLVPKKRNFLYRTFKADYPNPNKALYLALVFPGGGQLYNKRWWKAPIVWGGYAALIYAAKLNTGYYKRFKIAYLKERQGMEHEFSNTNLDAGDLKRLRDEYDKKKQLSYIGMFGLHIIQAAEAFVDCHLKSFDVSDDLSLHFKPSLEPNLVSNLPAMGVGVAFCFGR